MTRIEKKFQELAAANRKAFIPYITAGDPDLKTSTELILALDRAGADPHVQIFHAGTRRDGARVLADGGRVLGVTARGRDIKEAQSRAYAAVDKIDWPQGFSRRDIGWRALQGRQVTTR